MDTLIVEEVLKNYVLRMMPDIMGTEYFFTHPYSYLDDLRTCWKKANLEKSRD